MLLLAGALILSGYIYDAVRIDIEGNLDLWYTSRSRKNAVQSELAESLIISSEFTLALYDVNVYSGLIILSS